LLRRDTAIRTAGKVKRGAYIEESKGSENEMVDISKREKGRKKGAKESHLMKGGKLWGRVKGRGGKRGGYHRGGGELTLKGRPSSLIRKRKSQNPYSSQKKETNSVEERLQKRSL